MKDFREQDFYELLDVKPHVSSQELERSYQRARRFFNADNVATYALFEADELTLLRRRIEEAYRVLSDPKRRRMYDQEMTGLQGFGMPEEIEATGGQDADDAQAQMQLAPEDRPPTVAEEDAVPLAEEKDAVREAPADEPESPGDAAAQPETTPPPPSPAPSEPEAPPSMPELSEDIPVTGALLRQAREAKNLSLNQIADVTKIAIYYLRNIETETFEDLPAQVYVRGYLRQIAKLLGLDANLVVDGYIARMTAPAEPPQL